MAISILYPSKRFGHEGAPRKLFTETFQSCACTKFQNVLNIDALQKHTHQI